MVFDAAVFFRDVILVIEFAAEGTSRGFHRVLVRVGRCGRGRGGAAASPAQSFRVVHLRFRLFGG